MDVTIGTVLSRLRVQSGESQEQVADATDISRVAYTRYENGQREPKASCAIRLAQHFGVTVEALYGVERPPIIAPQLPEEAELLKAFRSMTRERKDDLLQYVDFILLRQADEEKGRGAGVG